MKNISFEHIKD